MVATANLFCMGTSGRRCEDDPATLTAGETQGQAGACGRIRPRRLLTDADAAHDHAGRDLVRPAMQPARASTAAAAGSVRPGAVVDGVTIGSAQRAIGKEAI